MSEHPFVDPHSDHHFVVTGPEKVSLNGYGTLVGVLVCLHVAALAVWLFLLGVQYLKKRTGPPPAWLKESVH
eukprot:CAMPEP_0117684952 /NCGR_PEP_ID=MMETSP0804-20121206/21446_1 /TAXON_ID=1074897 /ORGANISM="Tetraselmis astigmatica, Strain CCMP880" /LENGTH=71 /DNA_ID=CAMNT_0005496123 /DNA_START=476 /DNA_END=691 /DNA_ORIENTATION=+